MYNLPQQQQCILEGIPQTVHSKHPEGHSLSTNKKSGVLQAGCWLLVDRMNQRNFQQTGLSGLTGCTGAQGKPLLIGSGIAVSHLSVFGLVLSCLPCLRLVQWRKPTGNHKFGKVRDLPHTQTRWPAKGLLVVLLQDFVEGRMVRRCLSTFDRLVLRSWGGNRCTAIRHR